MPSLTVLVGLGVAACTSIIGLPDLPDAPGPSGSGGKGGTTAGTGAKAGSGSGSGSGRGGSASAGISGVSGDAASSAGGSSARGGSTSGDAGESVGGEATGLGGAGNTPGTGGVSPTGGSSAVGGGQGDGGTGNSGTGGDSGADGGGAGGKGSGGSGGTSGAGTGGTSGKGSGGASSGAGGMAGSTAGAGMGGGAGTAGTGGASTGSTGCNKAPGIPATSYNNGSHIDITAASLQRRYILNVPSGYDNTHPYRLVIAFHWNAANDDDVYANQYFHLLSLANNTAIFVAPNGQASGAGCTQKSGCGWPDTNNSDVALVDAIVAQVEASFCVDKSRIFVVGFSYGASMAYKTACKRPLGGSGGYVRATAVYSGQQLSGSCTPTSPVAYYASHGAADTVIDPNMGVGLAQTFSGVNGCSWAAPTAATNGNPHVCTTEPGCDSGYPTKFCSFYGDHTADPLDPGQSTSWEYQTTWDFLKQF